jgi:FkbM family methyltransferase
MSRAVYRLLNTALPVGVRTALRRGAIASIPSMRHLDMPFRLKTLAQNGFQPRVIFDIGAASGDWARLAAGIWPSARIHGFEPNQRERASLERTKRELPAFDFTLCFLGSEPKRVQYDDQGTSTSVLNGAGTQTAEMRVLDELVRSGAAPRPEFLKLDVQGYELEVLRGGEEALAGARGALLEVSFTEFASGVPLVAEVVAFMAQRGFVWYDAMGIYRSLEDDALLQMDAMFLRREDPLRRKHEQR